MKQQSIILEEGTFQERSSLPDNKAISSHFDSDLLTNELIKLGYPERSIDNMRNCGTNTGFIILKDCGCGTSSFNARYSCNLRTCIPCAKKRQKRIRNQYYPYMRDLHSDRNRDQLYFLTLNIPNFDNFAEGLTTLRKSFNKFIRTKYIKERIKGGMYVIESKHSERGWNIHIHCVFYGRRLDNRVRGKCSCGQTLMKFDRGDKRFYCANKNCNSKLVTNIKDSKISQIFEKASGFRPMVDISRAGSGLSTLNYMLKYISSNKEDFSSVKAMAEYISGSRKKKLINTFGMFFKDKIKPQKCMCFMCSQEIIYSLDFEISELLSTNNALGPPRPVGLGAFF
jgi:hypothetical protein